MGEASLAAEMKRIVCSIYIQHYSPEKAKESNWLPAPSDDKFSLILRLYIPQEVILKGQYQYPAVRIVR